MGVNVPANPTLDPEPLAEVAVRRGACQKASELVPLISLLKNCRLRAVVEIGTLRGGTLWLWCQLASEDAQVIGVDLRTDAYEVVAAAGPGARQSVRCLQGDSHLESTAVALRSALGDRPVDLLFLDGDHSYGGVSQDFDWYAPMVREGGLVVCHDIVRHTQMPEVGVHRLWRELAHHFATQEFVSDGGDRGWGPWGGIGVLTYTRQGHARWRRRRRLRAAGIR